MTAHEGQVGQGQGVVGAVGALADAHAPVHGCGVGLGIPAGRCLDVFSWHAADRFCPLRCLVLQALHILGEALGTGRNEIVVDNEDPGFEHSVATTTSLLHKWIIKEEETGLKYKGMNPWRPPLDWTLTTNSDFYGLYVRSAHFIKSGTGDQTATWNLPVEETGYYDVYTYVAQSATRGGGFGPGRRGGGDEKGEYMYVIHHDDGETEQSLQVNSAENGWNLLGSFYLGPGSKIVLSNKSELRTVVADAIKLVKL